MVITGAGGLDTDSRSDGWQRIQPAQGEDLALPACRDHAAMGLRRTDVWNETRELKHSAIDGSPVWRVLSKGRADILFLVVADLQARQAKAVLILVAAAGTT